MGFWYLGSPYSKFAGGLDEAHRLVCVEAARLIKAGLPVYSPIAHTHPVALHGVVDPLDHNIWLPADRPMMDAAFGLIVLKLDGWDESFGLKHEIEVFEAAGKPIAYAPPGDPTLAELLLGVMRNA